MATWPSPQQTCARCGVFPNHKTTSFPLTCPYHSGWWCFLGCGSVSAQEQICSQEFMSDAGDVDRGRSHQGLAGWRVGGSMAVEVQNWQPWATAEQGSHIWAHLRLSRKKKKGGEKPQSSAEGIRIYCHIRWIQVNEKLRPDFISADNKTSSSHN